MILKEYRILLKSTFNHLIIIIFLIISCLPAIEMKLNVFPKKNNENRKLSQKPHFNIANILKYHRNYEDYFNDNFGFRNYFINLNSTIKYKLFKTSPVPQVIIGKNGWLFYHSEKVNDGITIDDVRGLARFSEVDLKNIKNNLVTQKEYLKQKGIQYIILIAPNKETIYPEYIMNFVRKSNNTRLDQFLEYMKKNSDLDIIDIRKELREAKKTSLVYFLTDTHWNDFGAFIACNELLRHISKQVQCIKTYNISDFEIKSVKTENRGGDLASMMTLANNFYDYNVYIKKRGSSNINQTCKINKVLMFNDSFGNLLEKYLKNNINNLSKQHYAKGFDKNLIERFNPDIIILEIVERAHKNLEYFK